ncbi:MAG: hypothetical protein KR126chlam5_00433 [Candidatus Anoxychlamydiales bacterium]|nr:hypothetical protein [Candidatus Anoxychlamydiales bacterium]
MQKLVERDTCASTDTPLVRSNCDLSLNREETLSAADLKTPANITLAGGGFKRI